VSLYDDHVHKVAYHISITGVVQGVGFRPFVYNLADRMDLCGWVLNHSGGVDIEVEGPPGTLEAFVAALEEEAPPLARIESLHAREIPLTDEGYERFEIRHSEAQAGRYQLISPDVATCEDCRRELFDPTDRRYRYPFINCTNCGPRFTIIQDIPYDRPKTTMRVFPLCDACRAEYEDPTDRRFHAQPNACPVCGPHLWLESAEGDMIAETSQEALKEAKERLLAGEILAVKGLGGFQLACDATNADAVARLRERKRRPHKPFAVMMATLNEVRAHCEVTSAESEVLTSPPAPIVLLAHRSAPDDDARPIVDGVAPRQQRLGVMLPYTPMHHLLLHDVGRPLVMTSGNLTEEPIAKENDEARRRLSPLADALLLHNRDIYARYDDSVVRVLDERISESANQRNSGLQILRRARGYAPFPIRLPFKAKRIFAAGPQLKNTFTLTRDEYAFVSQHIGDMENIETLEHYGTTLATYQHLFRLEPEIVACDLHPDYATTRLAEAFAAEHNLPLHRIQHHKTHIAAALAEHGWAPDQGRVIGVSLDGTGYGEDGAIWGGEWFVGAYGGFERAAHLEYLPLPGGDAAIQHPWRTAVAYLHALLPSESFPAGLFCPSEAMMIRQQVTRGINTPRTSSMGRLFDAVSALLGVRHEITYEAQAAIELEQLAQTRRGATVAPYPFAITQDGEGEDGVAQVRVAALFDALLEDILAGRPDAESALRFHHTVAEMIHQVCARIRAATALETVVLSGGVLQNRLLIELTAPRLRASGFTVLLNHHVPCNDGGVSLGQAVLTHFASG
jgi:hydrogenase maturation protein HypF